jgi:hypothetical protein
MEIIRIELRTRRIIPLVTVCLTVTVYKVLALDISNPVSPERIGSPEKHN